jgi:RNA polymerase sigma-70 factor, ECF subfamily
MDYTKYSDKELIEKIRVGANTAQDAFNALHKRWMEKVYIRAYRMVRGREDAEEITQEVFLSLYRMILRGGVQGEEPGRYIMRTTSNTCINALRRKNIGTRVMDTVARSQKEDGFIKKDSTALSIVLHKAIEKLDPKERLLVIQKYFEKKTTQDIADEMSRPKRVIDYHLERIRKILFVDLKEAGIAADEI